jgi:glutaredoxin
LPVTEVDLTREPAAREELRRLTGRTRVPVLVREGRVIWARAWG